MRKLTLLFLFGLAVSANAQWGSGGLFRFYASGTAAPLTDSVRVIAGTGVVITKSANQLTFSSTAVAPAGSVDSTSAVDGGLINADLRVSTLTAGRTTPTFLTTLAGGGASIIKQRTASSWEFKRLKGAIVGGAGTINITDATDSLVLDISSGVQAYSGWTKATTTRIQPVTLTDTVRVNRFRLGVSSTAGNILKATDASGNIVLGTADSTGITDSGVTTADIRTRAVTSVKIANLTDFLSKPDMLEFLGGALKETAAAGASDTTQNYIPVKAFSVNDTATFDLSTSKRFASLDSIVVIAYANTATSNVVFNCQIKQVQIGGAVAGAFNASSSKTIATGTAGTLRQWSFTSFGSVTASVFSEIIGKVYRTSGGTGGDVFVRRVLVYGVGLR